MEPLNPQKGKEKQILSSLFLFWSDDVIMHRVVVAIKEILDQEVFDAVKGEVEILKKVISKNGNFFTLLIITSSSVSSSKHRFLFGNFQSRKYGLGMCDDVIMTHI